MKLLLMPQKQITSGKASCTFRALERLLFCVRPLMPLQMFQSSEGTSTSSTNVRPRFVGLWRWKVGVAVLGTIQ